MTPGTRVLTAPLDLIEARTRVSGEGVTLTRDPSYSGPMVRLLAPHIELSGLTVDGGMSTIETPTAGIGGSNGISIRADGCVVRDCTITAVPCNAVEVRDAKSVVIEGNTIQSTGLLGQVANGIYLGSTGLGATDGVTIRDNLISRVTWLSGERPIDTEGDGIQIQGSATTAPQSAVVNTLIEANTIEYCAGRAVKVQESRTTVRDNTLRYCGSAVTIVSDGTVADCAVIGNAVTSMDVGCFSAATAHVKDQVVSDNTVDGAGEDFLRSDSGSTYSGLIVRDNTAANLGLSFVTLANEATDVTITGNIVNGHGGREDEDIAAGSSRRAGIYLGSIGPVSNVTIAGNAITSEAGPASIVVRASTVTGLTLGTNTLTPPAGKPAVLYE